MDLAHTCTVKEGTAAFPPLAQLRKFGVFAGILRTFYSGVGESTLIQHLDLLVRKPLRSRL